MKPLDPIREAAAVKALRESLGALGESDDALMIDMIEGETGLFDAFDGLLQRIVEDRASVKGLDAVIADLDTRKRRIEGRIDTGRALIEQAMMIAEIETKVERPIATLTLARRQPKVEIATESEIPTRFWKTGEPTLDKRAVAAALKAGEVVPGATLSNAAPTLSLRFA